MSKPKCRKNGTPEAKKLIEEVQKRGDKITPEDVIGIMRRKRDGKIIWLENGVHTGRGLSHIIEEHLNQFNDIGISSSLLPTFILDVAAQDNIVGHQSCHKTRPIYEYTYAGKTYMIAITIASNGFIVGANPRSCINEKERVK